MTASQPSLTFLISLFFFLLNSEFNVAQNEGEACTLDGQQGVCTILDKCEEAYQKLLQGFPPRGLCHDLDHNPVVCCLSSSSNTQTVAPGRRTSTTPSTITTEWTPQNQDFSFTDSIGFKARKWCAKYAESVYAMRVPPTLSANKAPVNISLCAVKTRKLIVGGKLADPKEFPHMVAIGFGSDLNDIRWQCGGTLISERYVLTAAHCTYSRQFGKARWARLGDLNLERTDDDAKPLNMEIVEALRYPQYRRPNAYHDIALLKLETNVRFNSWIRPSCLPYSLPDVGTDGKATATGWGIVEWSGDASSDLLKVTISLVQSSDCNKRFIGGQVDDRVQYGIVDDWQVCAGEEGKDTCQGDSGGPLVIFNPDHDCMYTVVGITSIGKACGSNIPGIYTRVYHYISWIESVVWPDT